MQHIGSGNIVLTNGQELDVEVNGYQISFRVNDEHHKSAKSLVCQVPYGQQIGKISTASLGYDDEVSVTTLRAVFISAGANGEVVSVQYSIYTATPA